MSIRPCCREACNTVFNNDLAEVTPFVTVTINEHYYRYCSPQCASMDLTERFAPHGEGKVLP